MKPIPAAALVVAAGLSPATVRSDPFTEAMDAGYAAAEKVREHTGSNDKVLATQSHPLMSEDPLATYSGKEFAAQLMCPASSAFLEVFAQPGPTGDLITTYVAQDLDLDGTRERTYTLPVHVSGVCANGIISCKPGTWEDCHSFLWQADVSGAVGLAASALSDLGGCYCLNNACGAGLVWTNIDIVVKDIGSAVAGAMSAVNPGFMVSRAEASGPTAQFWGQDLTGCAFEGDRGLADYRATPSAMEEDARTTANDPGSYYSLLESTYDASHGGAVTHTCQIRRNVQVDELTLEDIVAYNGGTGSLVPCGEPHCLSAVMGSTTDNNLADDPYRCRIYSDWSLSVYVKRPDKVERVELAEVQFDDWLRIYLDGNVMYEQPGPWLNDETPIDLTPTEIAEGVFIETSCENGTNYYETPGQDLTAAFTGEGARTFSAKLAVGDRGDFWSHIKFYVQDGCEESDEWITDECESFATDPKCQLVEESVDGVMTYRDYNPTGLVPLGESRPSGGESCDVNVYREWWTKDRKYLCENPHDFDFTDAYTRAGIVTASTTPDGRYADQRLVDGQWVPDSGSFTLPDLPGVGDCTVACKTRKPVEERDVGGAGPVSSEGRNIDYVTIYRPCHDGVCEMGDDEELVTACGCLDDFPLAATMMQTIRLAGQDLICTSGTPQTPAAPTSAP